MTKIKDLERQLKEIKLERQIKEESTKTSGENAVKKAVKKKLVKKAVKKKYKGIKGYFQPRGTEEKGLDFLMRI